MSAFYEITIDHLLRATLRVEFTTVAGSICDYSIVLILGTGDGVETIRVYDAAHGFNEMHRYTRGGGKQAGVRFHPGTLGEGMRDAIAAIEDGYSEMIEGWRSR
ncbi:MAG: hypothetical protein AB7L18_15030 [Hyphomicrobiaceae bacterium]